MTTDHSVCRYLLSFANKSAAGIPIPKLSTQIFKYTPKAYARVSDETGILIWEGFACCKYLAKAKAIGAIERRAQIDSMTEDDVVQKLQWDFINDLRERLKYVKLCHRGDFDGDEDGLLWHFTRLSTLRNILLGGQIWLTDLASSNDEHEIVYALDRVPTLIGKFKNQWSDALHGETIKEIANSTLERFRSA